MFTVVTSFSPSGFETYGRSFLDSFHDHWPIEARLLCFWEGTRPAGYSWMGGENLLELEPCRSFLNRHAGDPVFAGKKPHGMWPWRHKVLAKGYNFRYDAYKFARKVFAIAHAARGHIGKLFWIDADVVTKENIPADLIYELLPDDVSLCYLPRLDYHSELGFVGYNLDHLETHAFITAYERTYVEDEFIRYPAWDDCAVFDRLVAKYRPRVKHIAHSSRAQPFDNSVLGQYMTHNKGNKKFGGRGWVEGGINPNG